MLPTRFSTSSVTIPLQDSRFKFAPVVDTARTVAPTAFALHGRHDGTCKQTVELPVWYGVDYNTCSMQTTTAPCFVSFPTHSCRTARPGPLPEPYGISGSTKLWIVIGITIFLTMIIPVVTLWVRWKLSAPRRGGKRSISIQLEKMEVKESSKAASRSSSTSDTDSKPTSSKSSGGKEEAQAPNGGRGALDRLLGRNRGNPAQSQGTQPSSMVISGPPTHCIAGDIRVVNNIHVNGRRQHNHLVKPAQHIDEPPPISPRIALESLPLNHRLRLPENQPWMHQDQNGRWVPRGEGYLHPGLPPSPHLRNGEPDFRRVYQVEGAGEERSYVPGGWRH